MPPISRWVSKIHCPSLPRDRTHRYQASFQRRWRKSSWLAVSAFALVASAKSAAADPMAESLSLRLGNGNPVVGKIKSEAERCQECHGTDGNSIGEKIPNHAGQFAGYLIKQLADFQSGARTHETMTVMAADLSSSDMADIAAYFASQKVMQGSGASENSVGRKLFVNGDQAREIPACVSCHAENGKGRITDNVVYPAIGGQRKIYLRTQLVNWKLGDRHNSPQAIMNKVAKSLSDEEIDALAQYLSGL